MSDRKFAVHRTTKLTGKPVIYFASLLAIVSGTLAPVTAHAQAAADIYKKMSDVYAYAKSFKGSIVRVDQGKTPDGKSASQTVTMKIAFKAPNKYVVRNIKAINVGGKSQSSDQTMITDGKSLFMFSPEKKLYQRGQIQNENMLARFFALLNPTNGFSLMPESTVNGRAVFVLKPTLPVKGTPQELANAKKVKINIMIDKQNYQFLKMTISSPTGNLTQSVTEQVVNGTVSDSVFNWNPPAGYKEIKAPTAPSGGPSIPRAPGR